MINNQGLKCEEWSLIQKAQDYDMTLIEVKREFKMSKNINDLYDRLESFIYSRKHRLGF